MLFNILKKSLRGTRAETGGSAARHYAFGQAEFDDGSIESALAAFGQAIALDPGNADIHYAIAKCQHALGNQRAMHASFQAALAANINHLPTHQLLSQIACPGPPYRERIADIHAYLRPKTYLEIGVHRGKTIALAGPETLAIGVDPEPRIEVPLGPNVHIHAERSDAFFARGDLAAIFGHRALDLAFIDGMHNFEFALRDFIGVERLAAQTSTVLVHDTFPLNRATAERDRITTFWSGDIWRMVLALKKYRPDLRIHTIATAPTGLTMIRGLDPESRVLGEQLDAIVAEFLALDYGAIERVKAAAVNLMPNDWALISAALDRI
jgi:tetratricopeptide (TPR) repeat protein